jgi:G3E family GTPase
MLQVFPSSSAGPFGRRLRRARGARIPVTVVTGPLGAGKTTLVRRFLATPEGRGTAVVINEFGAVGIDDKLVRQSADETVLLGNGCLCCNTRSDLEVALRRLIAERERGAVPFFGRVLIETSGLADPGPILQTFVSDRALGGEFHVEVVVAVIDAVTGAAQLDRSAEARRQIILADRVVVSKSDLAGKDAVKELAARLTALNPRAAITVAVEGDIDPTQLIEPMREPSELRPDAGATAFSAEAVHDENIRSFVLALPSPIAWNVFARTMETLVSLRGADLLRVKGLLNVEGCRGPVVVQFVQHLAHPPVELDAWPDQDRSGRLVFITRDISEAAVRGLFAAASALMPGAQARGPIV